MSAIWRELKRRNVIKVAIAYFIVGWILIEVSSVIAPALLLPPWTDRLITILVMLGFPLALVLSWLFDMTTDGIRRDSRDAGFSKKQETATAAPTMAPPDADAAAAAVAVLPFDDLGDAADEKLGDGVATEIHDRLSKLHRLRVASRRSAFRFRGADHSLQEISTALNVRYVLSGSVMRSGDRVRIIAELDDVSQDAQVWSQRFERDLDNVLLILSDIADAVVGAFGGKRLQLEMREAGERDTENADAWQLVQTARSIVLSRGAAGIADAEAMLTRAIELDESYAVAHAALASVIAERILNGASEALDDDSERASMFVARASELAPEDSYVLKSGGMVLATIGEASAAIAKLEKCVEIAPYDFGAWGYLGWPLTARGRVDDLDRLDGTLERIASVAPEHPGLPFWIYHRAVSSVCRDDLERARDLSSQALARNDGLPWVWMNHANLLARLGASDEARDAVDKALSKNPLMTPAHYVAQIRRMSEDCGFVQQRISGLEAIGSIPDDA